MPGTYAGIHCLLMTKLCNPQKMFHTCLNYNNFDK